MDHHVVLIASAVAVVFGYLVVMCAYFKESKELDKKTDCAKMKKWNDDED